MPLIDLVQIFALTATAALALVLLLWLISIPLRDVSIISSKPMPPIAAR